MKTNPVEKMSVSISKDLASWLRRAAAKRRTSVSQILRELIVPHFEARHAK